jgi:hypothetical protein
MIAPVAKVNSGCSYYIHNPEHQNDSLDQFEE